jgi:hypothetical protein
MSATSLAALVAEALAGLEDPDTAEYITAAIVDEGAACQPGYFSCLGAGGGGGGSEFLLPFWIQEC